MVNCLFCVILGCFDFGFVVFGGLGLGFNVWVVVGGFLVLLCSG